MSEIKSEKPTLHVNASPEVGEILGFNKQADEAHSGHSQPTKKAHEPAGLPVVDSHAVSSSHSPAIKAEESSHDTHKKEITDETEKNKAGLKRSFKIAAPYLAVFFVGLLLYYFFLSKTDLSTVLDKIKPSNKTVQTPKETALMELEKQNLENYRTWIAQYYFDVSDVAIIDPNGDNSGNGLSNFQKYLLGLNPRSYDTLGLGMADSQALALGLNPLTGSPLNDKQKEIVDKYFDMEVIMNRLALSNLNNSRNNIAGAAVGNNNYNISNSQVQNNQQNNNTGSLDVRGYQQNNNSISNQNNAVYVAPKTGVNLTPVSSYSDNSDIDQAKPGLLEVPSLKISVPIVWTQDSKNFDRDLQSGVVHYPGTALPGQIGTTYISGHSSNYAWAKGSYNKIFSKLGDLANNASFIVTVYTKEGKTIKYHYVVTHRAEYKATDQAQFENAGTQTVALSTCWPVNTTQKRLVVFGELTQTER